MAPGKYPHLISIQGSTVTETAIGDSITVWDELAQAWARVEPISGREKLIAAQMQAETTHKVTMRHPGIEVRKSYEIVLNGRRLEVESVLDTEERGYELVVMCKEKG